MHQLLIMLITPWLSACTVLLYVVLTVCVLFPYGVWGRLWNSNVSVPAHCLLIHLFGKELFIRFTASAFRKLRSIYVFSYFPFGFEGRMWDLIVSVPDHCLSFYFG